MLERLSISSRADRRACAQLLSCGSRTFKAAGFLLPPQVRSAATAMYAFCRLADDAVDLGIDRLGAVARFRARLDAIYQGRPQDFAADRAFADVVDRHEIPRIFPDALLEGFLWDAEGRTYETLPQLRGYAVRVAGTVGGMMALIMGVRSRTLIARACELGVAMQFTNIARDVGEDARNGRVYLPRQWLRDDGLSIDAWLSQPVCNEVVSRQTRRLLQHAAALYVQSDAGIAELPRVCRAGVRAARLLYAEIGAVVERDDFDFVASRAVVPGTVKGLLLARGLLGARSGVPRQTFETIPEAQFLLDALPVTHIAAGRDDGRLVGLLRLFEGLQRREYSV